MWPEVNSQSGQSRRQVESIKKPGVLPERGGKVLSVRHPNVVLTLGLHPIGETWHEEKW